MNTRMLITGIFFISCWMACNTLPLERTPVKKKEPKYCVTVLQSSADSVLLTENEQKEVKSLFELNHLELDSFQFYQLQRDELDGYHVRANQFANGLQVFGEAVIFHFDTTQMYTSLSGHLIPAIELDTLPTMARDTLIGLYLEQLAGDEFYSISGAWETIKKGCFEIELGYFHLNEWSDPEGPRFVKAWMVKPQERVYPYAYIADADSTVLYYENGVREGR